MVDPNLPDTIDMVSGPQVNGDLVPELPPVLVSHGATEKSTICAEIEVVADGTDNNVVIVKKEGARRKPIVWRAIQKEDTEGNVVFPFLENGESPQDYQLVSTVAMQRVYEMSHETSPQHPRLCKEPGRQLSFPGWKCRHQHNSDKDG